MLHAQKSWTTELLTQEGEWRSGVSGAAGLTQLPAHRQQPHPVPALQWLLLPKGACRCGQPLSAGLLLNLQTGQVSVTSRQTLLMHSNSTGLQ